MVCSTKSFTVAIWSQVFSLFNLLDDDDVDLLASIVDTGLASSAILAIS